MPRGWLQAIAHISPMYYTVEALRQLANGSILSMETLAACRVTVPFAVLAMGWATGVYRRVSTETIYVIAGLTRNPMSKSRRR